MPQITVRISQEAIDYREAACSRGIKKKFYDQRVFDFFMEHHPDPLTLTPEPTEQPTTTPKDTL